MGLCAWLTAVTLIMIHKVCGRAGWTPFYLIIPISKPGSSTYIWQIIHTTLSRRDFDPGRFSRSLSIRHWIEPLLCSQIFFVFATDLNRSPPKQLPEAGVRVLLLDRPVEDLGPASSRIRIQIWEDLSQSILWPWKTSFFFLYNILPSPF